MLNPPTDRLHKFLAISGVSLTLFGLSLPLQKFQDAEVQKIEALTRVKELQYAYSHYAEQVNRMIRIRNNSVSKGFGEEEAMEAKKKVSSLMPRADELGEKTERVMVETTKQIQLAVHMEFMRNLWFGIGLISVLVGAGLAYIGFRRWLSQPCSER